MIGQVEGQLRHVEAGRARVACGPLTLEIHVPTADVQRLCSALGEAVTFQTLFYLEGQAQGASLTPRLIGFSTIEDRDFFELFTSVKGIGNRKALRALALPFGTVAGAIASRDVDILKSLPEIGKRTAETIVASLHGKVDRFIELKPDGPPVTGGVALDAVTVLTQLGEAPLQARQLVERALAAEPELKTAEDVVAAVYRMG